MFIIIIIIIIIIINTDNAATVTEFSYYSLFQGSVTCLQFNNSLVASGGMDK